MSSSRLVILGAGTSAPTKNYNPAGFLLLTPQAKILIECGFGIIRRLVDYGLDPNSLDLIFASHFHPDHFGDLFNLIFSRFVADSYATRKPKPLPALCPKYTASRFHTWRQIYWREPTESYPVNFIEGTSSFDLPGVNLRTFPVKHVTWCHSLGLIVQTNGLKIVFTGDIGSDHPFNKLVSVCHQADYLVTEASYTHPTPNHFSIPQIEKLVKQAQIKHTVVVHVRPQQITSTTKHFAGNPAFSTPQDFAVFPL